MPDTILVKELASRLTGIAIISSDITDEDVKGQDVEGLVVRIMNRLEKVDKPAVLTKDALLSIVSEPQSHAPIKEVEVIQAIDFRPTAKDIEEDFEIRNVSTERTYAQVADFAAHFNDRLKRLKDMIYEGQTGRMAGMMNSIESIKQYAGGRDVVIAGMVYDKIITKNGHTLITIEDETGVAKVLFIKPQYPQGQTADAFAGAQKIVNDEVIAVRGKISGPFVIANSLVYPDIPVHPKRKTKNDIAIGFMSDVHVGSKLFMQKHFERFLEWVNGKHEYKRDLAAKMKYIVVSGDLVDGIGVYPNQDKELSITDIYLQYKELFDLFSRIPEYVHVFLLTGNHDAVQRAEPQPQLPQEFYKDFKLSNIHLVSNPGYVNLEGLRILGYHGTSLDSVIQGIPGCSYSKPEGAMLEVLKRRHLSPIYGDNPIVPARQDSMIIDKVPDILHMGHLHKNGYAEYHGTAIVNSGTWQSRTGYQERLGHIPTPAQLPVYEGIATNMSVVDFNNII